MYNSRYVPPTTNRRSYPQPNNQKPAGYFKQSTPPQQSIDENYDFSYNMNPDDMPIQPRNNNNNGHTNQGLNHLPAPVQKRVQIIDHNRQTPSTEHMSGRDSQNSYSHNNYSSQLNQIQPQKPKPRHEPVDDNKSDSTFPSIQRPNNFKIHEYLYGLSAPDPGLYVQYK